MEFDRHTYYIAASYGMLLVAIVVEVIAVRKRRASARQRARMISVARSAPDPASQAPERHKGIAPEAS